MIPAIFSAFKLSSLVVFPKNITPMVISTKMIYLYFNFLLAHTASCLGAVRVTLPLNYIIKLYCFQYTSSYLHNA